MQHVLITYDLNKSGKDYSKVTKAIKSLGDSRKPTESTFVVKTDSPPYEISAILKPHFDSDDEFFVCRIQSDATGTVFDEDFWAWF